jgi:hypothetical protein
MADIEDYIATLDRSTRPTVIKRTGPHGTILNVALMANFQ